MSTDLSNTAFAERSQKLMNALVNLHGMNAEAVLDSDLPRIVVFGDQSAGKSSLVEGVTGIRVPRDSGTCTRCPTELSIFTTGDTWNCSVSLQFKYDQNGRPLKLADVKKLQFGEMILDKSQVEIALRRAQAAILNPSKHYAEFLQMSTEDLKLYRRADTPNNTTLKFSKNTISVKIHDPTGANLTFLDLPGLITNEDKVIIDLVQDLAVGEIKNKNSIILITIPMTSDMELQTAVRLAKEVDPYGSRTIGVLTKPDAVPKGALNSRETWMKVLSGKEQVLTHGYYCVRLPDDEERMLNLSREEQFLRANNFFVRESPWNTLQEKHRLGIPGLVEDLSRHLTVLIDKMLPKLRNEVQKNLEERQAQLDALPPVPKLDAQVEILKMTEQFCQELKEHIFGSGDDKTVVGLNRATYEKLSKAILKTGPYFIPFETSNVTFSTNFDADDSDCGANVSQPYNLLDVRRIIKETTAWELPHNVPFDAKKYLIKRFLAFWDEPAISCHVENTKRLQELLKKCITKHFKDFSQLRIKITALVEERLQEKKDSSSITLKDHLKKEREMIYLQNRHYFDTKRDFWLRRYKEQHQRRNLNTQVRPSDGELRALQALSEINYRNLTVQDLARLKPSQSVLYEEELVVMADVKAYFHVAYKRFIDEIPRTIERCLNRAVCEDLQGWLIQQLDFGGYDAQERLTALIAQNPEIKANRERLEAEISKLKDVQKELRSLGVYDSQTPDSEEETRSLDANLDDGTERQNFINGDNTVALFGSSLARNPPAILATNTVTRTTASTEIFEEMPYEGVVEVPVTEVMAPMVLREEIRWVERL